MLCELLYGIRQGGVFKPISSIDRFISFCCTSKFKNFLKLQNLIQDTDNKNVSQVENNYMTNFTIACSSCEFNRRLWNEHTNPKLDGRKQYKKNSSILGNSSRFFHALQTQTRQFCNLADKDGHQATPTGPPWRVLFLGSDYFALYSLKALVQNR